MSRSYWIAGIALGLACIASPTYAQNGQPHSDTEHHQADNANGDREPRASQNSSERNGDAEQDSSEGAEAQPQEGQINTPPIHQGIEGALVRLADSGDHQTKIVVVGTFLLFGTLVLTAIANWITWRAVQETRRIGEAQTRAYVAIANVKIKIPTTETALELLKKGKDASPEISIEFWNHGNSPATRFAYTEHVKYMTFEVVGDAHTSIGERVSPRHDIRQIDVSTRASGTIPPKSPFERNYVYGYSLNEEEVNSAASEKKRLIIYVAIQTRFEDVFEEVWYDEYGFACQIDREMLGDFQATTPIDPQQVAPFAEIVAKRQNQKAE